MNISIKRTKEGDVEKLFYEGPINEDSEIEFATLIQSQLPTNLVFNFKEVEYINSCGVRAWVQFLREIEPNRKIVFEECAPDIVLQVNMIPNFRSSAHIKSVFASYVCDDCGSSRRVLFEEGQTLPCSPSAALPEVKCESCSAAMEMEEIAQNFFAFAYAAA